MDARPGDKAWRTDTIMVVAVDHDSNQVGIFSIPRDLWVDVPTLGPARINQADYHGETSGYPGDGRCAWRGGYHAELPAARDHARPEES
jgi:anionic cell wall polymer biosynthesis LytR-Cps2A-Psr (LCP) family protein